MVWKLGGRHTHSRDKYGFRAMAANGTEEGRGTLVCESGSQFLSHFSVSLLGTSTFSADGTQHLKVMPPPHRTEKKPQSQLAYGPHSCIPYRRLAQPVTSQFYLAVLEGQHCPLFPS